MTTLADFSQEQLADCVGMWCEIEPEAGDPSPEKYLAILQYTDANAMWGKGGRFVSPKGTTSAYFRQATLRDDLPRVWYPDGTPCGGE